MVVRYVIRDGELVSRAWAVVYDEMVKDLGHVEINEGHRTIARQTYFWNCYQCRCCNNGNLAARPTIYAPHIRIGFANHAIDFGDPERVFDWLKDHGLNPSRPAGSGPTWEPWHIEVPLLSLLRFAQRHKSDKFDTLPKHVERAVRKFIAARNTVKNRVLDRDEVDSKKRPGLWKAKDKLVDEAVAVRNARREKLEHLLHRSKKPKVKRILRSVLN